MFKKVIITLIVLVAVSTPARVSAQSQSEAEYRAYLLQLIELLQQQIILLQVEQTQVSGELGVPGKEEFESFLIEDNRDVVAWYTISNPTLSKILPDVTHSRYFSRFFEIVPDEYDDYFIDLLIYENDQNTFDGFVETVEPFRADTWRLGINKSLFEFPATSEVVNELFVHEFGHVISYEQIEDSKPTENASCHEFFDDFGCPPTDSYLLDFLDEFWSEADMDAAVESNDPDWLWSKQELRENFVTDYAASNPAEDFAESFAFFVFEDEQTGDAPKEEKINYFYDFPPMLELRKEIRNNL